MAHIADGPTENCIPSCSLPVCVSLWGQWLSYKWINNPKAKVNSLRTILKRSFSLAFMRANFYSPNANSQFSCICIWRQVRRESDHFDYFPVSFFGFQCARGSAETSLQVVILSHHRNWSTFWPKLAKTGQNGLCAQCAFAQLHARKSWGVIVSSLGGQNKSFMGSESFILDQPLPRSLLKTDFPLKWSISKLPRKHLCELKNFRESKMIQCEHKKLSTVIGIFEAGPDLNSAEWSTTSQEILCSKDHKWFILLHEELNWNYNEGKSSCVRALK